MPSVNPGALKRPKVACLYEKIKRSQRKKELVTKRHLLYNKAGYTAQDAPRTRPKITGDGPTDGPTDRRTQPPIEMRRRISKGVR